MPNLVRQTLLAEGTQKAVIHWYFESDGNEGEFTNKVILDPSVDFAVPVPPQLRDDVPASISSGQNISNSVLAPQITILRSWASCAWFDLILGFDGDTPRNDFVIARDTDFELDFTKFGGLADRVPYDQNPTGKLLLTTRDFAPAGSAGFLILEIRKN